MKLILHKNEYWIKDKSVFPSNFNQMSDDEKWRYIRVNNLIHRIDGPAFISSDGAKRWYLNGKKHRLDGSAEIYPNGSKYWYLNGIRVDRETYKEIQNSSKEKLLVYMINPEYKNYLPLIEYRLSI